MNRRFLQLFLLLLIKLYPDPPSFAITESMPSTMVAGTVNAITGDHYVFEEEITIQGAFPLKIPRIYISRHGDKIFSGWQLFPHFFAGLYIDYRDGKYPNGDSTYSSYWRISIREPNGTVLEFESESYRPQKNKPIVLQLKSDPHRKGLTNMGRGTISARTNLKNIRIEMSSDKKYFTVYAPDGTIRFYKKIKAEGGGAVPTDYLRGMPEGIYLLQWEQLPNQSKIVYGHDGHHRLDYVSTTSLDNTTTFASATIHYHSHKLNKNRNFDIKTSDGRILSYQFEPHTENFLLKNVNTPVRPQEELHYHEKIKNLGSLWGYLLKRRNISANCFYDLDYYWQGYNKVNGEKISIHLDDPRWLRVKTLSRPVGEDNAPHITHNFTYDIDKRVTHVREIDNTLTRYRYSENYRIEQIQYYTPGEQLHHSEKYVWGEEGLLASNLLCHTFLDSQDNPIFSRRYFYDDRGNPIEEKLYGNLSGVCNASLVIGKDGFPKENGVESYSVKHVFSNDRFNLLLREEEQNGKVTINSYRPDSSILESQLTCDRDQIKIRHFYEYNEDALLVREIVDDGSTSDKNNLSNVHARRIIEYTLIPNGQPYPGMPCVITEKYWNGSEEKQLRRTNLQYTTGGCVEKEEVYDADNHHCFTRYAQHDLAGRIKQETNPIGQAAFYDYDAIGNKIYHKDFSGRIEARMDYDGANRLRKIDELGVDKLQQTTRHRYDTKNNRIATIDPYGNETRFTPDNFGNIIQVDHPPIVTHTGSLVHPTEKQQFDVAGRLITSINARHYETHKKYNARNQETHIVYPDGYSENFVYNLEGTLASHTNQAGATTTYTYDFLGRTTSQTNALGLTTFFNYDSFNLTAVHDAEGNLTTYRYDGAGRKISEDFCGEKTEYSYDSLSRLRCTKNGAACHITEYDYLDRVIEERDEDDAQNIYKMISYQYDDAGNVSQVLQIIDGKTAQETFKYDSLNRQIEHLDALVHVTTTIYDDNFVNKQGQRVVRKIETDPLGLQTITTYDVYGQISSVEKNKDKVLDLEELFYDESSNLVHHIQNHNHTTTWQYDPMNRIDTQVVGGLRSTHFAYTKSGLVMSKKKPDGMTITNQYDLLDQLKETASSDHSIWYTFNYNKIGQQIAEKDEIKGIQTIRQYDPHGKLLEEKLSNGLTLRSEYDEQGRKTRLVLPNDTDVIFQYDPVFLRRIIREQKNHDFNEYDSTGRLIRETPMGSLGTITYLYDPVGRKTAQETNFHNHQATYDPVGNLIELRTNQETKTFDYNDLYQLTREKNFQYSYDLYGNRTSKNQEEFKYNELNENISHQKINQNGNPEQDGDISYAFDALDRLTSLQSPSHQISFHYDYEGRLLSKIVNGTPTFYLYDDLKEIGSFDASGSPLELRILNPTYPSERGATVLLELNNQSYIPIHDLFGNVIKLLTLQGALIESYDYSAYGEGLQAQMNPWQYASKRWHPDCQFISFVKRFYNPKYGRWLTPDPAGFIDGYNLYAFVANNPLTNFDHYGLFLTPILSYPPAAADWDEATRYSAPIIHAIGDMVIDAGNFLAMTGFAAASPLIAHQNNYQLDGFISDFSSMQEDFSQMHNAWDQTMQRVIPANERESSYNLIRSGTELAAGGYMLARAAGSMVLNKGMQHLSRLDKSPTLPRQNSIVSKTTDSYACSSLSAIRLRNRLIAQEISGGHAFEKHVIQQREFQGLIQTRHQFAQHIENVINDPMSKIRELRGNRRAYWHDKTNTIVIRNPSSYDGGTAFQPQRKSLYFLEDL